LPADQAKDYLLELAQLDVTRNPGWPRANACKRGR
jgi:hypothetical protein